MTAAADKYLTKALKYPSFELQAKASLAVVKAGAQKWEEALTYASSVSTQVGDRDPTMLNIIGIAASNVGKQQQAEDALTKALALNPDNPVYHRDLGVVLVRSQKLDKARQHLETAALSPTAPPEIKAHATSVVASITEAEVALCNSLVKAGRSVDAMPVLTRISASKLTATETRGWADGLLGQVNKLPAEDPVAPGSPISPAGDGDGLYPVNNNNANQQDNQAPVIFQAPQGN